MSAASGVAPRAFYRPRRNVQTAPSAQSATLVWLSAVGGSLALLGLFAAHQATLLRIAVPGVASAVALTLYLRRPIAYIHFTLWAWFIAPLVRRVIDWKFGFADQNLVLLAPFLVSAIAALTVIREGRRAPRVNLTPYLLCTAGVVYGFLVGVIRWKLHVASSESIASVIYGLFMWLAPLVFGLHLHLRWRNYEEDKSAILASFKWGVLLLGAYGVYQYVVAPAWDCAWLDGVMTGDGNASFGRPSPYEIRVWSTSNSPGTFATIMLAGLILLIGMRSKVKIVAAGVGYLSFLLSQVRTAWLGWILSVAFMAVGSKGATLRRFLLGILVLPVCLLPLMLNPRIEQSVQDRLDTMQDVGHDDSFQDRADMYRLVTLELFHEPSGRGLMNSNVSVDGMALDSGILQVVLMLGIIGAALFSAGIAIGCFSMFRGGYSGYGSGLSPERTAFRALFLALLAESISGNNFVNINGAIFWTLFGLWMAASVQEESAAVLVTNHNPRAVLA